MKTKKEKHAMVDDKTIFSDSLKELKLELKDLKATMKPIRKILNNASEDALLKYIPKLNSLGFYLDNTGLHLNIDFKTKACINDTEPSDSTSPTIVFDDEDEPEETKSQDKEDEENLDQDKTDYDEQDEDAYDGYEDEDVSDEQAEYRRSFFDEMEDNGDY